jgi:hypothetical protein
MYVIIRTYSAGCFAGDLESKDKDEVVLTNARRLWRWVGAATLSELAVEGTSDPRECKFAVPVPRITLPNVIEIIETTDVGRKSIQEVPKWHI